MEEQNASGSEHKGSNKTLIVVLVVVGILVVLGVVGNFVWGYVAQRAAQKIGEEVAEEALEQQTGGEVELGEGTWPSDLPSELQYPDSTVTQSADFETEAAARASISLETSASYSEAYDYYAGLTSKGWTVSYKYTQQTSKIASVSLKNSSYSVAVTMTEEEGKTTIGMLIEKVSE